VAISPSIPTSFVPRQQAPEQPKRPYSRANNIFTVIAYAVLFITVVASGATYAYASYLQHTLNAKSQALVAAQASVDQSQVQNFIQLRDRLVSAQTLLTKHVTLTSLFDVLEKVTVQNIQFTGLKVTVTDDRSAQIDIDGIAKNFNSLAVQSNALATQKGIKQAIFSGIAVNKLAGITFHLNALIDPSLVIGGALTPSTSGGTVTVPTLPVPVLATSTLKLLGSSTVPVPQQPPSSSAIKPGFLNPTLIAPPPKGLVVPPTH
jgi:hypothetical protein